MSDNIFGHNLMNGSPLVTRTRSFGLRCKAALDYEDFAETMRRAKARGLIVDGPPMIRHAIPKNRKPKGDLITVKCIICAAQFQKLSSVQVRTCSLQCFSALRSQSARNRKPREATRQAICIICNAPFVAVNSTAMLCSNICKEKNKLERKKRLRRSRKL